MVYVDEYDLLDYLGTPSGSDISDSDTDSDEHNEYTPTLVLDNEFELFVSIWQDIHYNSQSTGLFDTLGMAELYDLAHKTSSCFDGVLPWSGTTIKAGLDGTVHTPMVQFMWENIRKRACGTLLFDSLAISDFEELARRTSSCINTVSENR